MSVISGYSQFLRKYRLLITNTRKISVKSTQTHTITTDIVHTGRVTASSLTVRAGAGSKYKSLGTLKKNASVTIQLKTGSYYRISYKKGTGGVAYVLAKYVKVTSELSIPKSEREAAAQLASMNRIVQTATRSRSLEITDLRVVFNCEKAVKDTPNYSVISVYNMASSDINTVKAGDTVVLEAGYQNGNYGMIFTGQIVQPYVTRESATDTALNLVVQDGDQFLNKAFVMTTLAAASTQADVVAACVQSDGSVSPGTLTEDLSGQRLIRGKVLFGGSAYYLQKAATGVKAQFYVEDGKVNIVSASTYASNRAVELNPLSGLIDMPGQTDDGISAKCLINPSIRLNTLVHIDSSLVAQKEVAQGETKARAVSTNGIYKIISLSVRGDTHGDDWYMEFEAVEQSGKKPGGLTAGATNSWR